MNKPHRPLDNQCKNPLFQVPFRVIKAPLTSGDTPNLCGLWFLVSPLIPAPRYRHSAERAVRKAEEEVSTVKRKKAREARKWVETIAKLLRAIAEFWNAIDE